MDDYRDGRYDVACNQCGGDRVIPVIDRKRCDSELLAAYDEDAESYAEGLAIQHAEMRMGA